MAESVLGSPPGGSTLRGTRFGDQPATRWEVGRMSLPPHVRAEALDVEARE
jgi:hypothetical protein